MPQFLGFDHIQLGMTPGGEERARAFYVGVLAMTEFVPPAPLRGLWFHAGTAEVHLDAEDGFRPSGCVHAALRVRGPDGLAALAARCVAAGHVPRHDKRYRGRWRFYVKDPFGNELELLQLDADGDLSSGDALTRPER